MCHNKHEVMDETTKFTSHMSCELLIIKKPHAIVPSMFLSHSEPP
jgi:hypothetical protein